MKGFVSITIARRQSFACVIQPLNDRNFRYCWSMAFNSKAGTIARWASWNAYGISIKFHSLKRVSRSELGQFSGLQNMSFCKLTRRFWLHHLKKIDSVRGILGLRCSHDKDLSFFLLSKLHIKIYLLNSLFVWFLDFSTHHTMCENLWTMAHLNFCLKNGWSMQ